MAQAAATHHPHATAASRAAPTGGPVRAPQGEPALVRRAKSGDADAFARLIAEHEGAVLTAIRFRLPAGHEAEDVAQEAFLRAWGAMDSFDEARPFRPWMITIAIRAAISIARRDGANRRAMGVLRNREAGPGRDDAEPIDRPRHDLWRFAQRRLPQDHATALWLRYGEDMPIAGVARALGRTEIAVRVLLSRARARLAGALDDHEAEHGLDLEAIRSKDGGS
jgi:RNA polymerase sigma factor (sigma-70 family)